MLHRYLNRISNKREILARALKGLGFIRLLERAAAQHPALAVFTYHRIAVPGIASNLYYDPVISATPEAFEAQVQLMLTRFQILSLQMLLEIADGGQIAVSAIAAPGKPIALITFDDGYRDNCTTAVPILRKLGVPATFFIVGGFLDTAPLPWRDHLAYVFKQTQVQQLVLKRWPEDAHPVVIALGQDSDAQQRIAAIGTIVRLFLEGMVKDEAWFLAQLDQRAELSVNAPQLGRELFMDVNQVKQLMDAGMAVGSHSQSHQALATLDEAMQLQELSTSKRFLESVLGQEVHALAYPFGWAGTFNERTVQLARGAGYRLAFSALEGVNRPGSPGFQPLALRRLNVGTGDSPLLLRARVVLHTTFGKSPL